MKQDITLEQMVTGLYHSMIGDVIEKPLLVNEDGRPILNKRELSLLLVAHILKLLEENNIEEVKMSILKT